MRTLTAIVATLLFAGLPGCSMLIHHSGITVHDPDSRDGVQKQFGTPDSVTQSQRIDPDTDELRTFDVENYHIHAKFNTAMPTGAGGLGLLLDPFLSLQGREGVRAGPRPRVRLRRTWPDHWLSVPAAIPATRSIRRREQRAVLAVPRGAGVGS